MNCTRCLNRGLIRLEFKSGEPFDVAICVCPKGRFWRATGVDYVRKHFGLSEEHQVGYLEDFDDEAPPAQPDFIQAGKTRRAKL